MQPWKRANLQTCKLTSVQTFKITIFKIQRLKVTQKIKLYQLSNFKSQTVNMSCSFFFFFKNDKLLKLKLYSPRQMQFLRSCLPVCQPQVLDDVSDFESDGERYDQPPLPPLISPFKRAPSRPSEGPYLPLRRAPPWKGPICPQNRTVGFMTWRV